MCFCTSCIHRYYYFISKRNFRIMWLYCYPPLLPYIFYFSLPIEFFPAPLVNRKDFHCFLWAILNSLRWELNPMHLGFLWCNLEPVNQRQKCCQRQGLTLLLQASRTSTNMSGSDQLLRCIKWQEWGTQFADSAGRPHRVILELEVAATTSWSCRKLLAVALELVESWSARQQVGRNQ